MKLAIQGFRCAPNAGSESGITWNWVTHLARHHEVWVFTDIRQQALVEPYLRENPIPNLHFVYIDVPRLLYPWTNPKDGKKVRYRYVLWLPRSCRAIRDAHKEIGFDLCHHVSYSALLPPPNLSQIGFPYIWGPVGGGMVAPKAFLSYFDRWAWREALRTRWIQSASRWPSVRREVRNAAMVMSVNNETKAILEAAGAKNVVNFPDSGMPSSMLRFQPPQRSAHKNRLTIMYAGLLAPRKAVALAIDAVGAAKDVDITFKVLGEGRCMEPCKAQAKQLGIADRVHFLGRIPWQEVQDLYQESDACFFTSLRDTFGTTVMEAMAHGLPIVTLDHQGVGTFLPDSAAFKAPVTTPPETIAALAEGLRLLANDPEKRLAMGRAARSYAEQENWENRVNTMMAYYDQILGRPGMAKAS